MDCHWHRRPNPAFLPVAFGLTGRVGEFCSPGLGKQEAEGSAEDGEAAVDGDRDGSAVHGQHAEQRGKQASDSARDGAQTRGGLSRARISGSSKVQQNIAFSIEINRKKLIKMLFFYKNNDNSVQIWNIK